MIKETTLRIRLQKKGNTNSSYFTATIVDSNGERPSGNIRYESYLSKEDALGKLFLNERIAFFRQDYIKILEEGF